MRELLARLFRREPSWLPTADDFSAHWRAEPPRPHQIEMLKAHFRAPRHTIHPADMARAMDWKTGDAANLKYGEFARDVARALGVQYPIADADKVLLFATFSRRKTDKQIVWHLRPCIRDAIVRMGWDN
jgi:hypothetical protein